MNIKITLINNLRHKGDFLQALVKSDFKIIIMWHFDNITKNDLWSTIIIFY